MSRPAVLGTAAVAAVVLVLSAVFLVTRGDDPDPTTPSAAGPSGVAAAPEGKTAGVPRGWPTPASTGWRHTGVTLTPYPVTGEDTTISEPGTVIDGADIRSGVRIVADNVTIKRSRIMSTSCGKDYGCFVVDLAPGYSGLVLEDVEVTKADGVTNVDRAISVAEKGGSAESPRATIRRTHVHGTYRGILVGDNTVIEDSYVADQDATAPAEAHTAAISAHGSVGLTIRHNTIGLQPSETNSASMALYGDMGPLSNLLIEDNYVNGGTSCLWIGTDFPRTAESFVTIRDNLFGTTFHANCGRYDPAYITPANANGPNFTWTNNVWYAPGNARDGQPVPS